jgi:hypothetical protein
MAEHPVTRAATLLSHGQLLTPLVDAVLGKPGTPRIIANGLGRYFVGRPVLNAEQRLTYEYASDPERVLELAATRIRRERFSEPTFDYTRTFPVTRRLAYAAFEDTRPKNQPEPLDTEARLYLQRLEHLEAAERQKDLPILYDL